MTTILCVPRIVGTFDRKIHELSHGERVFLKKFGNPRIKTLSRPPTFMEAVGLCEEDIDILLLSQNDFELSVLLAPLIRLEERHFQLIRVDDLPFGIVCYREVIWSSGRHFVWSNAEQILLTGENRRFTS
jgi:hypothetical protein